MNPALLILILAALSNQPGGGRGFSLGSLGSLGSLSSLGSIGPTYFDTFKMELLLDKLHSTVDALERVNRLNQIASEPLNRHNSAQKIKESVDAVKPFLPDQNQAQLSNLTGAIDSLKQFGDMQGLMQTMGPMLKLLTASASPSDSQE